MVLTKKEKKKARKMQKDLRNAHMLAEYIRDNGVDSLENISKKNLLLHSEEKKAESLTRIRFTFFVVLFSTVQMFFFSLYQVWNLTNFADSLKLAAEVFFLLVLFIIYSATKKTFEYGEIFTKIVTRDFFDLALTNLITSPPIYFFLTLASANFSLALFWRLISTQLFNPNPHLTEAHGLLKAVTNEIYYRTRDPGFASREKLQLLGSAILRKENLPTLFESLFEELNLEEKIDQIWWINFEAFQKAIFCFSCSFFLGFVFIIWMPKRLISWSMESKMVAQAREGFLSDNWITSFSLEKFTLFYVVVNFISFGVFLFSEVFAPLDF
eukprot:snap_masked-scaffold_23-processed-gene-4.32-mRNA-1 protein AED:1.00 eAED:1.00 QI:0/-1/0/0/-1/1/1/0/325